MIPKFQNRLLVSLDITIFGKRSLKNGKIILNPFQAGVFWPLFRLGGTMEGCPPSVSPLFVVNYS